MVDTDKHYLHDLIASDRRNPTVNANGPLYGSPEYATDNMPILDPKTNKVTFFKMPVRGSEHAGVARARPCRARSSRCSRRPTGATRSSGTPAPTTTTPCSTSKGRVWLAATVRGMDNPACCKKGSEHPSAKVFPLEQSPRQVAMLDPKTMKYTFVDTCFGTHHPQFGYDANDTLWLSGTGPVAGWVNTKVFDETGDAAKARAGRRSCSTPTATASATTTSSPTSRPTGQGQAHRSRLRPLCGDAESGRRLGLVHRRRVRRPRPASCASIPKTGLREFYNVPTPAFGIRGGDIDKNGVRLGLGSSGHLVSFDRRKCKGPLNGPNATGDHCPEGWSLLQVSRARASKASANNSAEASYYTWVDQHNTLGLGENIPISTANLRTASSRSRTARWS